MTLDEFLARYQRIAIAGGPQVGKTSVWAAHVTDRRVLHTDDWMGAKWADVPYLVLGACQPLTRFCVEGVQVPRTLRKGLEVDAVVWLAHPLTELSEGQERMRKAVETVFRDWQAKASRVPPIYKGGVSGRGEPRFHLSE